MVADGALRLAGAFERELPAQADHVTLRERASETLRPRLPYDLAVWATVDPLTTMWTSCVIDGGTRDEVLERQVFENEYGVPDVLKLRDLAHGSAAGRAATLALSTAGDPAASARFREVYAPRGFADELRIVFSDGHASWGALVLLREDGRFTPEEADAVTALGKPFALRLRRSLLQESAGSGPSPGSAPGVILCSADGRILDVSDDARRLLGGIGSDDLPAVVGAVVAKFRAGAGTESALPGRDGSWLTFHASGLGTSVAVVVEQIRPHQLAEILVRSAGLTARERDVLTQVMAGASSRHIAGALGMSEYTVQDHLKRVFAKFEVNSRAELLSKLFFTHYAPHHGVEPPSASGHFRAG